ncbi:MAG TPA: flagellar basal body P-ring formation chaperone FlgA [Planctomycetaceae bacterium]|nr:flagellar basal body P-ring formation chaperone FlgA [Planctomycetaceae bacterium]
MPRFKRLSYLALTLGLIGAAASAEATEICFRATASVSGPIVRLKDVATVSGDDPQTVKRLEQTELGPAPAPGRSSRLEFDQMRSRLEAAGLSAADTGFSGATVVVVSCTQPVVHAKRPVKSKVRVNVSPAQVRRAEKIMTQSVRQSLRGKSREAGNLFLDVMVDPQDVPIVLASATEGFDLGPIDVHNADAQSVQVRAQDSQGRVAKFRIQCVVSEKPRIPVLTHSVSSGEVIREDDLAWKQVDNTEGVLGKFEEIVGKEAKKGLHADEPVHADDVRTIPLVRSNDIVTGIWRKGGIRISGQFKSKSDGGKGDVITLVQLTGHEQVLARVTDVHEAEIVTADVVRRRGGDADQEEADSPPPVVQTVAHKFARKQRRTPPVVNATATDEGNSVINGGATNAGASNAAQASVPGQNENTKATRDETSESSSR